MNDGILKVATLAAVVGQTLAWRRQAQRLPQSALAAAAGVNQSTWSKIERGESSLTIDQLSRAAHRLGMTGAGVLYEAENNARALAAQNIQITVERASASNPALAVLSIAVLALLIAKFAKG